MTRTETTRGSVQNGELSSVMKDIWEIVYKDALDHRLYVGYEPVLDITGSIARARGKKSHADYGFLDSEKKRIVLSAQALENEENRGGWVAATISHLIPLAYLEETHEIDVGLIEQSSLLSGVATRYALDSTKKIIPEASYRNMMEELTTLLFPKEKDVLAVNDDQVKRSIYGLSNEEIEYLFYLENDKEKSRIPQIRQQMIEYNRGFRIISRFINMTEKWVSNPRREELVPGSVLPNPNYVYIAMLKAAKREGSIDNGINGIDNALNQNIHEAFLLGEMAGKVSIPIAGLKGALDSLIVDIGEQHQNRVICEDLNTLLSEASHLSLFKLYSSAKAFRDSIEKNLDKTAPIDSITTKGIRDLVGKAREEYVSKVDRTPRYNYSRI